MCTVKFYVPVPNLAVSFLLQTEGGVFMCVLKEKNKTDGTSVYLLSQFSLRM